MRPRIFRISKRFGIKTSVNDVSIRSDFCRALQYPVQLIREALPENRTRRLLCRCQLPQENNILFIVKFSFASWDNLNSSIIQQLGKYILDVCSVNVTYRCEGVSQEGQCYNKPSHVEITFLLVIRWHFIASSHQFPSCRHIWRQILIFLSEDMCFVCTRRRIHEVLQIAPVRKRTLRSALI